MLSTEAIDIKAAPDLTPTLQLSVGLDAFIECLVRRLDTDYGELFYDPDFGSRLRKYLQGVSPDPRGVALDIEESLSKDPRVVQVTASAVYDPADHSYNCAVRIQSEDFKDIDLIYSLGAK